MSRGQAVVHPAPLRVVLHLAQAGCSFLRLHKHDAVVQPVGLALPKLDRLGLDDVAAPGGEEERAPGSAGQTREDTREHKRSGGGTTTAIH